ncbi:MAG: M20 family metallopeptidase [Candidatus Krumholzibacteriia bacterium]
MNRFPSALEEFFPVPLRDELVGLRRDLHRYPELAFREERTACRLMEALEGLEPLALERVAGTGVIARIAGKDPGAPAVAVRGDIDGLPIHEDTGLEFSSENAGVLHACGHDVHAAWTVGAAHLLSCRPAQGDVLVLLQPAEETGKGAVAVLEAGVLDSTAAIFGAHVDRRFAVGRVVAVAGPLAAAADTFRIELVGRGAHGARPEEAADPIVGLGALIGGLQTIVSRRLHPGRAGVVSVGTLAAGTAANIIPDTASMAGTLRAADPQTRRLLHDETRRVAERTAEAFGLQAGVHLELGTPPIVNEEAHVAWARQAVTALLGEQALAPLGSPNMAGEDFAFYLERFPGCFLRIGAREADGKVLPAHSRHFYAAGGSIFVGAAVLAETARIASAALAASGT